MSDTNGFRTILFPVEPCEQGKEIYSQLQNNLKGLCESFSACRAYTEQEDYWNISYTPCNAQLCAETHREKSAVRCFNGVFMPKSTFQ